MRVRVRPKGCPPELDGTPTSQPRARSTRTCGTKEFKVRVRVGVRVGVG